MAPALTFSVICQPGAEDSTPRRHCLQVSKETHLQDLKTSQQIRNAHGSRRLRHTPSHPRTPLIGSTPPRRWRRLRLHNYSLRVATIRTPDSPSGPGPPCQGTEPCPNDYPARRCRTSRHRLTGDDASHRSLQPTYCHEHPLNAQLLGLRLSPFQPLQPASTGQPTRTPGPCGKTTRAPSSRCRHPQP